MANKTATSYVLEDPQADECRENIPPEVSGEASTSKLKVTLENETLHSSMQLCEENRPVCDTCAFSTPAPTSDNSEVKAKSGCQSALTPNFKSLNLDNECSSSQLSKSSNSPHLSFSFSSLNFSQVNCQKSTSQSGRLFCDSDAPLYLIENECLPEVTNLDLTYLQLTTNDSFLPENESSKLDNEMKQVQTNAEEENDDPLEVLPPVNTAVSTDLDGKMTSRSENKSVPAATGIIETEITLLDASNNSELSPVGQITSMDITQDFSPVDHLKDNITLSELSRQIVSEPGSSIAVPNKDLSNTSVRSVKCATQTTIRTSLDVTMGSILEKSDSSSETSGQKMEEPQTSDKDEVCAQPANITQNISSSSDMSAQGAHLSTSGVKCNVSSARATSEVHSDSAENSNLVKIECEEVQTSCDIMSTSAVSQQSHTWTTSRNRTFPFLQSSNTTASDCNSTISVFCPENKTFDLSDNSAKAESEAREQAKSTTTKTSEKESSQGKVQNATFDRNSLQKTCDSSTSGEAAADDLGLQNTSDCKGPLQNNCTVTLSEISSGDIHCNTLDEPFSPKVSNLSPCPEDEDNSSELLKPETAAAAQPNDGKAEKHNDISEANSAPDSVPGVSGCEFKDLPQSGLPVSDGHFNALNNESMVNNKASTFDLDETLDLEANFFITSTPMTSSKTSNLGSEQTAGTNLAVQKKLYQDDPNKPTDKVASNIPSNIICDHKTFFAQPIPRALRPPSKATSQMLKNKSGSTVPERIERVTTGLPIKRQKTQAGAVKITAVEEPHRTSGMSITYNLRSIAAASKLPTSGLQRPQQSSIPSGISKPAPGLRPLSARSNRFASSSTNKPTEPKATNPVTKFSQGKKHPLSKGEALPISKRKKTDTVAPSSNTEATTSSCDTTNRVKTLKQPTASLKSAPAQTHSSGAAGPTGSSETSASCDISSRLRALKPPGASLRAPLAKPQGHGCSRCVVLQEELKQKSDEIQRLKQELQKYQKQEDS